LRKQYRTLQDNLVILTLKAKNFTYRLTFCTPLTVGAGRGCKFRKSTQPSCRSAHLHDYLCYNARLNDPNVMTPIAQSSQKVSSSTRYPIQNYVTYNKFSPSHQHFVASLTKVVEPKHFQEASRHPQWRQAMAEEI